MSAKNELMEVPVLTCREQYKILRAANRAKKDAEGKSGVRTHLLSERKNDLL